MSARAGLWGAVIIGGLASSYAFALGPSESSPAWTRSDQEATADPGPSVRIARRVVDAAGAFDRYFRTVSAVSRDFDGAASVSGVLMASAAYDARHLEEGAVAYAALVALQEPTFVESLHELAADSRDRAGYVERLNATPEVVLDLAGASEAAAMASTALHEMGSSLVDHGRSVRQAAYDLQRQPWALEQVPEPAERLARVQAAGANQTRLSESETRALLKAVVAHRRNADTALSASEPTPTVVRGLALAAAAVLGQAGENRGVALSPLLREPENGACLRRAKLNLHQCIAASGPQYEDVFCAGEHAMVETGQCIVKAAGGDSSDGVRVPVAGRGSSSPRAADSVSVPVAGTVNVVRGVERSTEASEAGSSWEEREARSPDADSRRDRSTPAPDDDSRWERSTPPPEDDSRWERSTEAPDERSE